MSLHFVNPYWFLALLPLVLVWVALLKVNKRQQQWSEICDSHLLPHLLQQQTIGKRFNMAMLMLALAWTLTVISLAEPAWSQVKQPVFRQQAARVFLLDMSPSMLATDLPPSRMERAKFKLLDMLRAIHEGQTALVAYTREPFLVSPLTEDSNTIASMVPTLTPAIMPVEGSDLAPALKMANGLFHQASLHKGEVVVLTDSAPSTQALTVAADMSHQGIHTSVMGVGTTKAVPLKNPQGGFLTDPQGAVETAKLPVSQLQQLASQGGGIYVPFSSSNADVRSLLSQNATAGYQQQKETDLSYWQVQGRWLLIAVALIFVWVFRRGFQL